MDEHTAGQHEAWTLWKTKKKPFDDGLEIVYRDIVGRIHRLVSILGCKRILFYYIILSGTIAGDFE